MKVTILLGELQKLSLIILLTRKGKEAEKGCIGCPWYDIERWKKEVKKKLGE